MYKGMYIAASGAVLKQKQMDILSNNLANVNTMGFRKDNVTFKDFLVADMSGFDQPEDRRDMSATSGIYTDFAAGGIKETGNPLDAAIDGNGFFALEGGMYTRRGDFKVDAEGYLALPGGTRVVGDGGPILVPQGTVNISESGEISVNGEIVGRLLVSEFADMKTVVKNERGFFTSEQDAVPSASGVKQGYLETSNVNVVDEMVTMMENFREFEAYQKMIQAFDETSAKVTNDMARL